MMMPPDPPDESLEPPTPAHPIGAISSPDLGVDQGVRPAASDRCAALGCSAIAVERLVGGGRGNTGERPVMVAVAGGPRRRSPRRAGSHRVRDRPRRRLSSRRLSGALPPWSWTGFATFGPPDLPGFRIGSQAFAVSGTLAGSSPRNLRGNDVGSVDVGGSGDAVVGGDETGEEAQCCSDSCSSRFVAPPSRRWPDCWSRTVELRLRCGRR